jgi:hypothetical protein
VLLWFFNCLGCFCVVRSVIVNTEDKEKSSTSDEKAKDDKAKDEL